MKQIYFLPLIFITPLFGQTLKKPILSHESGFYDNEFNLTISHEDSEATIIYTIDGSEPDINNLNGRTYQYKKSYPELAGQNSSEFYTNILKSYNYSSPIVVYNRTNDPNRIAEISTTFKYNSYFPQENIEKAFVVRAKAYKNSETSNEVNNIYFVDSNEFSLPIMAIHIDDDKLFGYEKGLWVAGKKFEEWRTENPTLDADIWTTGNYWASGSSSEIKANIIYLDNQEVKLNQNIGIRNHGNGTRYLPNRSFRFYAKNGYGKGTMDYNFFEDYDYDSFKRIILRNSGSDTNLTMFRDAFAQTLSSHLNFNYQNYQPVSTFINGEYYGLFNIRERFDEKYFERVFDLEEDDIDFLENNGLVDLGDDVFYNQMMEFYSSNNLSDESLYRQALTYIDEINFTDYHIAEIYSANYDWPHNNNEYFRKRVEYNPDAPYAHDGRFRWVLKDFDVAFNGMPGWIRNAYNHNTLVHAISNNFNGPYVNYVFQGLLTNNNYKYYFINRFSDLLNTSYKPNHAINLINSMQENLRPEISRQITRWGLIENIDSWESNVEELRTFATERPTYQKQHLIDFFNLDGTYQLTTNVENVDQGFVKVNTIEINNSTVGIDGDYSTWSGDYFIGVPVKLSAVALPGYKFSHWTGDIESSDAELTINATDDLNITAVFERSLSIGDVNKVDFLLYPNPTNDVLNISSASKSEIKYSISTILGQKMDSGITKNQTVNVNHLAKGVYLIELNQDNKRVMKKFIKK